MSETTTTYWVRAFDTDEALECAESLRTRYDNREAAERTEPTSNLHTYEITVTDHGYAPKPTRWFVSASGADWFVEETRSLITADVRATHGLGGWEFSAWVLATSRADAKRAAIEAWHEAGFIHAPKAVDA